MLTRLSEDMSSPRVVDPVRLILYKREEVRIYQTEQIMNELLLWFLAPTGAQGVKMYVRVCVCDIPQMSTLKEFLLGFLTKREP